MLLNDYRWNRASPRAERSGDLPELLVRRLGLQEYLPIFNCMRYLAENAKTERQDEIWLLSHKPVFTQGQAGKPEHVLNSGPIPLIQADRGGQVTYHGPGQLVVYPLLDLRRRKLGARDLVNIVERSVIATLAVFGIEGAARDGAPGVYVDNAKIAALGLRIKNGRSYHGLSLNVNMDLSPFASINPCGFSDLAVCQLADYVADKTLLLQRASQLLCNKLLNELGYEDLFPLADA